MIMSGQKRTTIRRWNAPRVKPQSRAWAPGLGWLFVESVEQIDLKKLTLADAEADGFASVVSMQKTLFDFYPDYKTDGRNWFRVTFRPEQIQQPAPTLFSQ
jgi:hypothetical protein